MKTELVTPKMQNRLECNNKLVEALISYEARGLLHSQKAQQTLDQYNHIQVKLRKCFSNSEFKHFFVSKERKTFPKECEICGFPVTSLLTKHHVVPQCKGGKNGKVVMLCPTCHCAIHRSVDRDDIDPAIVHYLEGVEGAVEKFGKYVRLCAEA